MSHPDGDRLISVPSPRMSSTWFTPGWSTDWIQPEIGNGTLTGEVDGRGRMRIVLEIGGNTRTGRDHLGRWRFRVPADHARKVAAMGRAEMYDFGSAVRAGVSFLDVSGVIEVRGWTAGMFVGPATPFTWSHGDKLTIVHDPRLSESAEQIHPIVEGG